MDVSEKIIAGIITFAVTTPIMLWAGRMFAKIDAKSAIYNNRIDLTVDSIRKLTDDAVNYYTSEMEDRERIALTAIVTSNLRRISSDIADIAKNTGNNDTEYMKQLSCYYDSITREPFGDSNFNVVKNDDQQIEGIRVAEEYLIIVMRGMIKK